MNPARRPFFAFTLAILCGFVALAYDVGHMVMVRAELQRTADAAALAGVTGLVPYTGTAPNASLGQRRGQGPLLISNPANLADNLQFTSDEGTVDYGYWLLAHQQITSRHWTRPAPLRQLICLNRP